MDEKSFQRFVCIQRPLKEVSSFIENAHNLCEWAKFFLTIKEGNPPFYRAETILGPALIRVVLVDHMLFEIISQFEHHTEKARIQLNQNGGFTQLTFTIFFPKEVSEDQQKQHLHNLQNELNTLKCILERQGI